MRPFCAWRIAGDVDFHFFIKYEWPAEVNDAANSALAQEHLRQMAPFVTSTQVLLHLCVITPCCCLHATSASTYDLCIITPCWAMHTVFDLQADPPSQAVCKHGNH